ncbi:MAG: Ni/Fe hydrogenase subunit alpha [Thaumarchaeota archaeon]|nr:MAG: Ni/Fe hydrogenase subunit alpha [Nitrososphaerota archaeon]
MSGNKSFEIRVHQLARVEGEGGVWVKVKDGKIDYVEVNIFEPPRFFEAFLRGRSYLEAPDLTARICGICPLAYVMAASRAMEKILGIQVPDEINVLRKIAFHGEWIESHVLHFAFLHAPDFLGYPSALDMAREHPDFVKDAMAVRSWGNMAIEILGGRPVHPVGFRVGGLHRKIRKEELEPLSRSFDEIRRKGEKLLRFVLDLPIPEIEYDMVVMSLKGDKEYPILEGAVANNLGWKFPEDELKGNIETEQKIYSNALHYRLRNGRAYITGPIARFNLNYDLISPEVKDILEGAGCKPPLKNTYQSIIARAAETLHSILEIGRLVEEYSEPAQPYIEAPVKAGEAAAVVEAPRGMLYHHYRIDEAGKIVYADIIPPTAQNYAAMEEDILKVGDLILKEPQEKAQQIVETTIRNYDPCISCSVHAIRLKVIRE